MKRPLITWVRAIETGACCFCAALKLVGYRTGFATGGVEKALMGMKILKKELFGSCSSIAQEQLRLQLRWEQLLEIQEADEVHETVGKSSEARS